MHSLKHTAQTKDKIGADEAEEIEGRELAYE